MRALKILAVIALLAVAAAAGYRYGARTPRSTAPAAQPPESAAQQAAPIEAAPDAGAFRAASLADVLALPTDFSQSAATYALAARSDEAALRDLIDEADRIAHSGDREAALGILFARYGELDPRAALAHLDETGLEPKGSLLFTLFNSWSKVDLDAAIAAARERPSRGEHRVANDAILRAYAESDETARAAVASRLDNTAGGTPYSPDELINLAAMDAETALEHAISLPSGIALQVVNTIGGNWAMREPDAAYAYAARIQDPTLRTWYKRGVLFRWGERDPERVMRLLDESTSREEQGDVINSALLGIAMRQPETAFRLAKGISDAGARDASFRITLGTWAPEDPARAAAAVAATEDIAMRTRLAEILVPSLVEHWESPERTLEWAAEMDGVSGQVTMAAFLALSRQDPARAFALAVASDSTEQQARWVPLVIAEIAAVDPQQAVLYFQQLPDDGARRATAAPIAGRWAETDASAAEQWVLGLPGGEAQDAALDALLNRSRGDPVRAARLINGMQNQERRAPATFEHARSLLAQGDRRAAETLWERVALAPEQRSQLRRMIDDWASVAR